LRDLVRDSKVKIPAFHQVRHHHFGPASQQLIDQSPLRILAGDRRLKNIRVADALLV
jgi:hypothetical protein